MVTQLVPGRYHDYTDSCKQQYRLYDYHYLSSRRSMSAEKFLTRSPGGQTYEVNFKQIRKYQLTLFPPKIGLLNCLLGTTRWGKFEVIIQNPFDETKSATGKYNFKMQEYNLNYILCWVCSQAAFNFASGTFFKRTLKNTESSSFRILCCCQKIYFYNCF